MIKNLKAKKSLCTIILEYQNPRLTLKTLKSLLSCKLPENINHKVFIIDNSPLINPRLAAKLLEFSEVTLIPTRENTGFAAGNNIGLKTALEKKFSHILLLNNDVTLDVNALKFLFKALDSGYDLAVPKIYFAKGREYHRSRYRNHQLGRVIWFAGGSFDWKNVYVKHRGLDEVDVGQYQYLQKTEFATACCLLTKAKIFNKIKLFDENYFLYFEDADFSFRINQAGFKIAFQPLSHVWHHVSGSSASGSALQDYYLTRNRLLFGFRYAPFKTKLALFKQSLKLLFTGRDEEKRGIIDYYFNFLGKGSFR